jgi:hypothetical protein
MMAVFGCVTPSVQLQSDRAEVRSAPEPLGFLSITSNVLFTHSVPCWGVHLRIRMS